MLSKNAKIAAYNNTLKFIIKNAFFIYFLMLLEFIQVFTDAIRFSRLLSETLYYREINSLANQEQYTNTSYIITEKNDNPLRISNNNQTLYSDSDTNSIINNLKYLCINWQIKNKFISGHEYNWIISTNVNNFINSTEPYSSTNSNTFVIYAYDKLTSLIIFVILFFMVMLLRFIINKECNQGKEKLIIFENLKNLMQTDSRQSADIYQSDYRFILIILVNLFEIIYRVFSSIILDIFMNLLFFSMFNLFHFSEITNNSQSISSTIYVLIMLFSLFCVGFYISLNWIYISLLEINFRFSKDFSFHCDKFFSQIFDYFLLFSKIIFAIEKNSSRILIQNKYLFTFFRVSYFIFALAIMLYFIIKLILRNFMFLINKNFNRVRMFFLLLIIFNYISEFIFQHNYVISISSFENLFANIIFSYIFSEILVQINYEKVINLTKTPSGILYQMIFIIDYYYTTLNNHFNINSDIADKQIELDMEKLIFYILIKHKTTCQVKECKINQLKGFKIESIFRAFLYEIENPLKIHEIDKENSYIIDALRIVISDQININENKNKNFEENKQELVYLNEEKFQEKKIASEKNNLNSNKQTESNILRIIYSARKLLQKNNADNSVIFLIEIYLRKIFKSNKRQFVCFEIINQYLELNSKLKQGLFFIEEAITCLKSKNFKKILDLIFYLSNTEKEINESYIALVKNKTSYIDNYALYISTFLFREIFNNKLQAENDIIFPSDINMQIINNFCSDNYIVLTSNHAKQQNFTFFNSVKEKNYDPEVINKDSMSNNIKGNSNYNKNNPNSMFRIIKSTKKFNLYKNKKFENLFPVSLRKEFSKIFNREILSSDGKNFSFKAVVEFESYKEIDSSTSYNSNRGQNEENNEKKPIELASAKVKKINLLDKKEANALNKINRENNNANLKLEKKISIKSYNFNPIYNQFDNFSKEKETNLKICKFDSRIFPSLSLKEILIVLNINLFPDEIIIFEEDEKLQSESLHNLSEKLSIILNLPSFYLKLLKKNSFTFNSIFKTSTDNRAEKGGKDNINKINNFKIKEQYEKFFVDMNEYEALLIQFIEKLKDKDLIYFQEEINLKYLNFSGSFSKMNSINKYGIPQNIFSNNSNPYSNAMDNNFKNYFNNSSNFNFINDNLQTKNNNNKKSKVQASNLPSNIIKKKENEKENPKPVNRQEAQTNFSFGKRQTIGAYNRNNSNTSRPFFRAFKSKNTKTTFLISLFEIISTDFYNYKIFKVKLPDAEKNYTDNSEINNTSDILEKNIKNGLNTIDNSSVLNSSIYNANSESFSMNILDLDTHFKRTEKIFNNNLIHQTHFHDTAESKLKRQKEFNSKKINSYLYLNLTLIGIFVICGVVVLIIGIITTKKINNLFLINYLFNDFATFFFHSQMSLFINVLAYRENSLDVSNYFTVDFFQKFRDAGVQMVIPDYILKELEIKLDILKSQSTNLKSLIYSLKDDELNRVILNKQIDFYNIYNEKEASVSSSSRLDPNGADTSNFKVTTKKLNFFQILDIYQSYASTILINPDIFVNVFYIDNSQLTFNFKNFYSTEIDKYQNAVYHISINFQNIVFVIDIFKEYFNKKFDYEIEHFYNTVFYYYIIINLFHLILVFISILTMRLFREIVCQNIALMEIMLEGDKSKYLLKKIMRLKILAELYLENPFDLVKKIFNTKNNFYSNKKLLNKNDQNNQLNDNNSTNYNTIPESTGENQSIYFKDTSQLFTNSSLIKINKINFNNFLKNILEEKSAYLERSYLLRPLYNFLWLIFSCYYIYSNLLFLIFNSINNQVIYYNDLAELTWKSTHDLTNNVLILNSMALLNQSDYITTVFWEKVNQLYNPYYNNQTSSVNSKNNLSYYLVNKINTIYLDNFSLIRGAKRSVYNSDFLTYNYENIKCEMIYQDYNDNLIKSVYTKYHDMFPDMTNDLIKTCNTYSEMRLESLYLIKEEMTYQNKFLFRKFENSDFSYTQIKEVYDDFKFFDLLTIFLLIMRPIDNYININLILPLVQMTINNYLIFNVCYLVCNFFIDIIIFYFINKKIIKKVLYLNDNFKLMMRSLKV